MDRNTKCAIHHVEFGYIHVHTILFLDSNGFEKSKTRIRKCRNEIYFYSFQIIFVCRMIYNRDHHVISDDSVAKPSNFKPYQPVSNEQISQVIALQECLNTNTLGQLWTSSMPFLYPFIVQFRYVVNVCGCTSYLLLINYASSRKDN